MVTTKLLIGELPAQVAIYFAVVRDAAANFFLWTSSHVAVRCRKERIALKRGALQTHRKAGRGKYTSRNPASR